MTRAGSIVLMFVLLVLAACTVPERTIMLKANSPDPHYVTNVDDTFSRKGSLFIVTASGGGTRAAALTLGALRALDDVEIPDSDRTFLDEVDLISSVSGGSVTAAYFALEGANGFDKLENDFIRHNGIGELIKRALNPVTLARLSTDTYSRLDVLVDYFDDSLFGDRKFTALKDRRPYLILNAADMSGGAVFSFTQPQFDLLCANLEEFKLAEAVAASAAFPVALAPLAVKNHSPCEWQINKAKDLTGSGGDTDRQPRWPPLWIQNAVAANIENDPQRVRRGRMAFSYLNLDCGSQFDAMRCEPRLKTEQRQWVHLLDGGIADNLGLNEPLRLVSTVDVDPRFLNKIFQGEIVNLAFLVINARSETDSDLDRSGATPGILKMLDAATGSSIDAASFGMLDRLDSIVRELLLLRAGNIDLFRQRVTALKIFVVSVDFDYIEDPECRRFFKNIATSWTLEGEEITALNDIAGALMRQSGSFQELIEVYGSPTPTGPGVSSVCSTLQ